MSKTVKSMSGDSGEVPITQLICELYDSGDISRNEALEAFPFTEATFYEYMKKYNLNGQRRNRYGLGTTFFHQGYQRFRFNGGDNDWDSSIDIPLHYITILLNDVDPHKLFSDKYEVHHKNGAKCDNRPENLEIREKRNHGYHHGINKSRRYSQMEVLKIIQECKDMDVISDNFEDVIGE